MRRPSIIAALCLCAALLTSCSAVRLGYNQAPVLAYWWLDRYADFNDAQAPRVREGLKDWFAWHRRTQLPDYANLLARGQVEALSDGTPERACEWWDDLRRRVDVAVEQGIPAAAELMLTLTPEQIAHIEARYVKFNAEFRDEFLDPDPARRLDKATEKTIERAESLYGRLDEAQRERIRAWIGQSPFDPEAWLAERKRRQQDGLAMMRAAASGELSREQAQAALRAYAGNMARSPREPYRQYNERLTRFNCAFTANLHNSTTASQRQKAVQKLKGWETDLRALAASS